MGFREYPEVTAQRLEALDASPRYHCLVRHFLNSILRAANLAPLHEDEAKARGLSASTTDLSWSFIEIQLFGLDELEKIDELAASIQAQGVPILCQDVPPIPPWLS